MLIRIDLIKMFKKDLQNVLSDTSVKQNKAQ